MEKAWDDFWDQQWEPYGDFLTSEMQKAGISYEVYFKDSADDRYIHQAEEESQQNSGQNAEYSLDKKTELEEEEPVQTRRTMQVRR